jgi:glutathione peroxidase
VVLIVNVASYCGFTKQYEDMQTIWDKYKNDGLIVLGVPSKSFNQEKDNENDIKKFCEVNFGINFPMTGIQNVKGEKAHELYVWARETYGKSAIPKWNFHKILVDKKGRIADTYLSFTNPNSKKIISRIEELLY